ncbi:MAG: pyridoxal 5'-phosphate synthase lyase subunit PdxS, partial [Acidilobaceae archaeon]
MGWLSRTNYLEALSRFFYELAELSDSMGLKRQPPCSIGSCGTVKVKVGFPSMLVGGVIMDVTSVEQAE